MQELENLDPPFSLAYLSGGTRIIFGHNEKANIFPSKNAKELGHFTFAKRSHIHSIAEEAGLKFLAIDHALTESEVACRGHHSFSPWPMGTPDDAEIRHATPFWRSIANSIDDVETRTMADRIATQISVSNIHLMNALNVYHEAAVAFSATKDSFNRIVGDTYTARFAAEIQGLLNDLYSLRDFLLSLYGKHRFEKAPTITKLAEKIEHESNRTSLDNMILAGLSPNGPINTLSNYRDLVAHVLPMFSARSSFHIVRRAELKGIVLPRIVFPIFDELLEAQSHARGKKQLVSHELSRSYLKHISDSSHLTDALDFCHASYAYLLEIGKEMVSQFSMKPEITTITDEDLTSLPELEIVNGTKKLRLTVRLDESQ